MDVAWVVLFAIFVTGCHWGSQHDYSTYLHIQLEEECHLTEDVSSPFCDFSMDYSYLNEKDDSIAALINRHIQQEFLGPQFASLYPEEAVDSFKNIYLNNYRTEVGELYDVDKEQATSLETIPDWYHQTYSLVTFVSEGYKGIINASANGFLEMGGIHPKQWSRCINFDFVTGKLLTKEDVFASSARKDIENLLLDKLITQCAENFPDKPIGSLDDLQELGILQSTEIYLPDNFLLDKNYILFLFNRYDIAPYSMGAIELKLTYEEVGHYLKI